MSVKIWYGKWKQYGKIYIKASNVSITRPFFMGQTQLSYKNKMYNLRIIDDIIDKWLCMKSVQIRS